MPARYEHNYRAFGLEVLQAGFMKREMMARGAQVMAVAQSIAPVGDPNSGWYDDGKNYPGEYKASFILKSGRTPTRVKAIVENTSDHALAVEFGYGHTPKYRVLGKALGAAGGDIFGVG